MMYNNSKEKRKVILPTNDLNFKRLFASPELIHISKGFLQDLVAYDPLDSLHIASLEIETPYNFQEVNRLRTDHTQGILSTEVDYACQDQNGVRFLLEMQKRDKTYLEERVVYNISQKFTQLYANVQDRYASKYSSLKPVIAVIILEDNHFKDDIAIRFLRPYDTRYDVHKKNLNLGLEIYIELNKDISRLPENLQLWITYFKTGSVPEEAPHYLQEAAEMIEITSFTKEERDLADRIDQARQKRLAEDEAVRLKAEAAAAAKIADAEAKMAEEQAKMAEEQARMAEEWTKLELEKQEEKLDIARNLLATSLSIEEISKATGISAKELEQLN